MQTSDLFFPSTKVAGISTGLLNFVSMDDEAGMYSAFAFAISALLAVAYSAGMFAYRAISLRRVRPTFPFLSFLS